MENFGGYGHSLKGAEMYTDELRHHGIKGQKWGRRRFQNADGSLTSAGRQRYAVDIDGSKERVTRAKQKVSALKDYRLRKKALKEIEWEKRKLSDEKVKDKLNGETKPKSKHRLNLEQKYRERGMSAEEAEIAAYKRARTEKIIAGLAGATIASAAAIVAYKHYKNTVDSVIKPGTLLQNINRDGEDGIKDAFYFSMNKSDNKKYAGQYANQIMNDGYDAYETKISVNKALRVASPKTAKKALSEMIQNEHYRDLIKKRLFNDHTLLCEWGDSCAPVYSKALASLNKGTVDKNVYDAFNISLSTRHNTELNKKFYTLLKSKGYDVIMDMNDKKYSGYSTKSPMIAFGIGQKAAVSYVKLLAHKPAFDLAVAVDRETKTKEALKKIARLTLPLATVSLAAPISAAIARTKQRDKIVAEYRKEHPNTKLSYNEILDNYYRK